MSKQQTINLICEDCDTAYEKPATFREFIAKHPPGYFWLRCLKYCDTCRRKREAEMLRHLPDVVAALAKSLDSD